MLLELRAENYIVVDQAAAAFGPGLNLLTGETGAGKSILIDVLALLLGDKASSEIVRHNADKAVVSCVFEATPGTLHILEENGLDAAGEEIILRREITANGKARVFVNNQPATVATLRALAPELALVHAQSDTLGAFDQAQQRSLLDRSAGIALDAVAAAYEDWRALRERLTALENDEQNRLRMADLWRFQSREIEQAQLEDTNEEEVLLAEKRVLANAEKLHTAAMSAHDLLYESANSAEAALRAGLKQMEELLRYDARWEEAVQQLVAARATVEDIGQQALDFAENIQSSPERLEEIEDRLALLDKLKRKYGATLAEVIAYGKEVRSKLNEIENRDQLLADLQKQLAQGVKAYSTAAEELTTQRTAAAQKLAKRTETEINHLAMKAKFEIVVTPQREPEHWSAHGWDVVDYRIATNPGEPLKPLDKIASGGEMSRVLLALKVSVETGSAAVKAKKKAPLPRTLVFDEIDIGIGGSAAEAVGQKLKTLARGQQVLCITHLPQIAAFADQHFLIEKVSQGGHTRTGIRQLSKQERRQEIARMLSGAQVTETSLKHAEQMLKSSQSPVE